MRYHLTFILKKSTNNKCWRGCGEKGTFLHYWWECKLVHPLWRLLKKLKIELLYGPTIPHLGIYLEKIILQKDTRTPMLIASLFAVAKTVGSVQSLSRIQLFVTPWTAACQASLSITNSKSLLRLMSIQSVMPSNHLVLCQPLLLLPSIFPTIRVFSRESASHQVAIVLKLKLQYQSFKRILRVEDRLL